jgi:hypothetical protein
MKSVLIKRTDDRSCAPQRRHSSGNTSIKHEGHDEIGSRSRPIRSASDQTTHPIRPRSRPSGAGPRKDNSPTMIADAESFWSSSLPAALLVLSIAA